MALSSNIRRYKVQQRVRQKVKGTTERPRLCVFRSNKGIYAQVIDDQQGVTLASASTLKDKKALEMAKTEQARLIGKAIAEKAKSAGLEQVAFDRSGFRYHGRVKALADAAREQGLRI